MGPLVQTGLFPQNTAARTAHLAAGNHGRPDEPENDDQNKSRHHRGEENFARVYRTRLRLQDKGGAEREEDNPEDYGEGNEPDH